MRQFFQELRDFPKKGDMILLLLCLITSAFGCVAIASATSAEKFGDSNLKYIIIQLAATLLGVIAYALVSSIDIDAMSERVPSARTTIPVTEAGWISLVFRL